MGWPEDVTRSRTVVLAGGKVKVGAYRDRKVLMTLCMKTYLTWYSKYKYKYKYKCKRKYKYKYNKITLRSTENLKILRLRIIDINSRRLTKTKGSLPHQPFRALTAFPALAGAGRAGQ